MIKNILIMLKINATTIRLLILSLSKIISAKLKMGNKIVKTQTGIQMIENCIPKASISSKETKIAVSNNRNEMMLRAKKMFFLSVIYNK